MKTPAAQTTSAVDKRLTAECLLRDFGSRAALTRDGVAALAGELLSADHSALERWRLCFGRWALRAVDKVPQHLARLATRYGVSTDAADATALLLALQTHYALLVDQLAGRFAPGGVADSLPDNPFAWCHASRAEAVRRWIDRMQESIAGYDFCNVGAASVDSADRDCDLFKPLYQDLFPRPLRQQLGEYYTPDWLARHVLDQVGYTGEPHERLLDPSCGSGTFLLMALRRLRKSLETRQCTASSPSSPIPHPSSFPFPIVGFDINPLAVLTARANYLIAVADLRPRDGRVEVPVYLRDSIQGRGDGWTAGSAPFDFVVGNPPWIAWDNLSDEDRQATKPLWEKYGLFSLSGNAARHGGGKKDLSMLMLYATADRYLKPAGRLGMVITQTLFQTKGAGDGFRRFRLGPDGPPLEVLRVDDMVALRPFGDAANWTSTIVLRKGTPTIYPVPYFKWSEPEKANGSQPGSGSDHHPSSFILHPSDQPSSLILHPFFARPIDPAKPTSPWLVEKSRNKETSSAGPADYTARLGANSGGANGVYWVEVLGEADGGVLIRNLAAKGKHRIETVEQVIEPDLLYPLLRWGDVGRYRAVPRCCILLAQDPATRSGIAESIMHARWPRTLAYLEQFRDLLTSRAAYRRYQQGGPFYAMYNVGPYTTAPIKVVWRRMDRRINAAVIEPPHRGQARPPVAALCSGATGGVPSSDSPVAALYGRPAIPQETCVLVACDSSDEAHYLCAMLNSDIINELVSAHSVSGGKGFGTPGMFDYLPLRRFQPDDRRRLELSSLSRQAHAAVLDVPLESRGGKQSRETTAAIAELQRRIDQAVRSL